MAKHDLSYIHIFIYSKIRDRIRFSPYIKHSDLFEVIKRIVKVPRPLLYKITGQLEEERLIRKVNHKKYRVLSSNCLKKLLNLHNLDFEVIWD